MHKEYFEIKDNCRKGLLKYLSKAISIIPVIESPLILDIGCGTGVPTLALAEHYNGIITAVDSDSKVLNRLDEKVKELNLSNRITIVNGSLFNIILKEKQFDIILAEGFLNVVGFKKGFLKLVKLLKSNRFIIIHDEFCDYRKKSKFIESNNCKILDSFRLDEHIWWNDYYNCLEKGIASLKDEELLQLFKSELHEIELFKQDSSQFNSGYYIVEKY